MMAVQRKRQGAAQAKRQTALQKTSKPRISEYESQQSGEIAAWKSLPPNPLSELWNLATRPVARMIGLAVPNKVVEFLVEKADDAGSFLAGTADIKRQAGVANLEDLRHKPLAQCDQMALQTGLAAQTLATIEGVATVPAACGRPSSTSQS